MDHGRPQGALPEDGMGFGVIQVEEVPKLMRFQSLDILRLVLLVLVSINVFGTRGGLIGWAAEVLSGCASIAFFVISGFLVLTDDGDAEARIVRCIKRTALTFGIMLVLYFGINAAFYAWGGMDITVLTPFDSKRFWFEFLVLNVWPYDIGGIIWYVQALLYAYILIWLLYKLNLMRWDWLWFLLLFAFTVVTEELTGLLGFFPLRYAYLPACFLTRALPYLLLGGLLRRLLPLLSRVRPLVYLIGIGVGVVLCFAEIDLFARNGWLMNIHHLIGMPVIAFCLCALCALIAYCDVPILYYLADHARLYLSLIYILLHPLGVGLAVACLAVAPALFDGLQNWMWAVAFAICFGLAVLIGWLRDVIWIRRHGGEEDAPAEPE